MSWLNPWSSKTPSPPINAASAPVAASVAPPIAAVVVPQASNSILTPEALALILEFEIGGGENYYDRFLIHPELPGGDSGITVAIGYDLSTVSQDKYTADWGGKIDSADFTLLQGAVAISRSDSEDYFPKVKSVSIDYQTALEVFQDCDVHEVLDQCISAFPGFQQLSPNCQGALISLVFNRGARTTPRYNGDTSRVEMLNIKNLVPNQDYTGIASQIRHMERLWIGTDIADGMTRRREAEAQLVLSCVS